MTWTVALLALFGAGVLGSLSPCVLPLLPGVVLVLAGGADRLGRAIRMILFAVSAATTFALLGAVAGGAGAALSASIAARVAGGWLVLLAVATVAIDRGRWRLPQWSGPSSGRGGWTFPVALGAGCGAVWSPCVGPLVGVAATAAAGSGSAWRGAALLFVFGVGVATPAVLLAAIRIPLPGRLRSVGRAGRRLVPAGMALIGGLLLAGWYTPLVGRLVSGR